MERASSLRPFGAEPGAAARGEVLDPAVIDELRDLFSGLPSDEFGKLVREYLTGARDYLGALARASTDGDAGTAERAAHALRGASANMGAAAFAALCREIEEDARRGRVDAARLGEAEALFETVRRALARVVDGGMPS